MNMGFPNLTRRERKGPHEIPFNGEEEAESRMLPGRRGLVEVTAESHGDPCEGQWRVARTPAREVDYQGQSVC